MSDANIRGIGMTSARTRDRLIKRLQQQGIKNLAVLERIRHVPRHLFVDWVMRLIIMVFNQKLKTQQETSEL